MTMVEGNANMYIYPLSDLLCWCSIL